MNATPDATVLADVLVGLGPVAIAVSGGVDSLTLATFAHRHAAHAVSVFHAVSPAVPAEATRRVRQMAKVEGWQCAVVDAGEFADNHYRANPTNRCYFCKNNLYGRIRALTEQRIASGTNVDDLRDYRPGLLAAAEHNVAHPFVEARMDKVAIRRLACSLRLGDIAELPAQPCLASRVETGIGIEGEDLSFVERIESALAEIAPKGTTLRCRITGDGVVVEVGMQGASTDELLRRTANAICTEHGRTFIGVRPYRRGSMFLLG